MKNSFTYKFLDERMLPVLLASAVALVYLVLLLAAGGGSLAAPLDDAYIYFQYARQMAQSHPFQFNTGDPVSTGATSLLYQCWLALCVFLGCQGKMLVWAAFLTAWACLASSFISLRRLATRWAPKEKPGLGLALLACCGPLMAGYFSGLELALFSALLLAGLEAHADPKDTWIGPFCFGLLAFVRPEGQIAAACFGLASLLDRRRQPERAAWGYGLLVPLSLLPSLILFLLTGSTVPDSLAPKSPLLKPGLDISSQALSSLDFLIGVVKGVLMGAFGDGETVGYVGNGGAGNGVAGYFMPLALPAFLWGVSARLIRQKNVLRTETWVPLLCWMTLGLLVVAAVLPVGWHRHRYLQPFYLPFILGLVLAAGELKDASLKAPAAAWAAPLRLGFWALALGFGALSFCQQAVLTYQSARNYQDQHFRAAEFISRRVDPGARVSAVDVGLLAYASGRPIQDMAGVTDHRLAPSIMQGEGATLETFLTWPRAMRPMMAVFQEGRPDMNAESFLKAGLLVPQGFIDHPDTGTRTGFYWWNWDAAEPQGPSTAALKVAKSGGRLKPVDDLNIGLPVSEKAHAYLAWGRGSQASSTRLARFKISGSRKPVLDPGRLVYLGESFALFPKGKGRALLVARLKGEAGAHFHVQVYSSDGAVLTRQLSGSADSFDEIVLPLPAPPADGGPYRIKAYVEPPKKSLNIDPSQPYGSYHYWLYQENSGKN